MVHITEELWLLLSRIGCPDKFIDIICSFHDGMLARVLESGELSEAFTVSNSTKKVAF